MAHRIFRLSITPERAPEVRRVVDFDGRCSLHDVHSTIQRLLELDDDHLYAFYLTGKYFDRASEYGSADDSSHDSSQARLFRLGLKAGQRFAYLFDFGDELRHSVTVVSITEAEAPLAEPVLVESEGDAPPQYEGLEDEDEAPYELPEQLTALAPLAETVLSLCDRLDVLYEEDDAKHDDLDDDDLDDDDLDDDDLDGLDGEDDDDLDGDEVPNEDEKVEPAGPPEEIVSLLRELSKAALELAVALKEDEDAAHELDQWSGRRDLLPRLVELPLALVAVGELEGALAIARAFKFVAPESSDADIAIILAESGKRDEAVAQLAANLEKFPDSFVTALKSGAAYEALGDAAEAEAFYRKASTLAEDEDDEEEAFSHLVGFLDDAGRVEEVNALLSRSSQVTNVDAAIGAKFATVGRNDPCPCGNGKKYKKCHGAA